MNAAKTIAEMAALVRLGDDPETAARILDAIAEQVEKLEMQHEKLVDASTSLRDILCNSAAECIEQLNRTLPDNLR